jgi:hypothetical protein
MYWEMKKLNHKFVILRFYCNFHLYHCFYIHRKRWVAIFVVLYTIATIATRKLITMWKMLHTGDSWVLVYFFHAWSLPSLKLRFWVGKATDNVISFLLALPDTPLVSSSGITGSSCQWEHKLVKYNIIMYAYEVGSKDFDKIKN